MADILVSIVMGIVEGLTEFIPVSSTGHLIITGSLLGFDDDASKCFNVFIQLGAILAVVFLYFNRFTGLLVYKVASPADPSAPRTFPKGFRGPRGWLFLGLTSLPATILGLAIYDQMKHYLFRPETVIFALAFGGVGIILAEIFKPKPTTKTLDDITWKQALFVGLFQCLALWPGTSRSASTIVGGMIGKLDRTVAAEYSFLAAVPIMFMATVYDLYKSWGDLTWEVVPMFATGFIVSFIVAAIAIKTFIKLLQRWTLVPFAIYRIFFAGTLALFTFMRIVTW